VGWPLLVCFALWVGYGILMARRSASIRRKALTVPRSRRAVVGAAWMLGGMVLLFGILAALPSLGLASAGRIQPAGWAVAALAGLGFVHAQTMGMAQLVLLAQEAVTSQKEQASDPTDPPAESKP
jgi:protein-S-isoprenylcysteine O-methyltransferase Ste14